MATSTLTAYNVTCICEITGSALVNGCKTWKTAAKKAAPKIQDDIEIIHSESVQDFEKSWNNITENNCSNYDNFWEVSQTVELSMTISVKARNWKEAANQALEIAQDAIEIVSDNDVTSDWRRITEDMVD